jgi:hypothetical protein
MASKTSRSLHSGRLSKVSVNVSDGSDLWGRYDNIDLRKERYPLQKSTYIVRAVGGDHQADYDGIKPNSNMILQCCQYENQPDPVKILQLTQMSRFFLNFWLKKY